MTLILEAIHRNCQCGNHGTLSQVLVARLNTSVGELDRTLLVVEGKPCTAAGHEWLELPARRLDVILAGLR
jgi:hypothetical protein